MSFLGIDIGTSGCKSVAFDERGKIIVSHYREYDTFRDATGRSEIDARDVWDKIAETIRVCAEATKADPINGISVTSMGESMVPLDADFQICGPSVLGSDLRGVEEAMARLEAVFTPDELYRITAAPYCSGYSFTALYYLSHAKPDYWKSVKLLLPWADFAVFQLTGSAAADYSLAERTYCFDAAKKTWSGKILSALDLTDEKLPAAKPCGTVVGKADSAVAQSLGLPSDAVVALGSHDQCAGMLGAGIGQHGGAMLGLGTFACMSIAHGDGATDGAFGRIGLNLEDHIVPGQYASYVYHGTGGSLVKWMRNQFFRDCIGEDAYVKMDAEISDGCRDVVVLPYFAETGPYRHQPAGRGAMADLSLETTRGDLLRAAMAGVVFYFRDALEELPDAAARIKEIRITGGGARSQVWRQLTADILQRPVVKTVCPECGAMGCAVSAAVASGHYRDFDEAIAAMVSMDTACEPQDSKRADDWFARYKERRQSLLE